MACCARRPCNGAVCWYDVSAMRRVSLWCEWWVGGKRLKLAQAASGKRQVASKQACGGSASGSKQKAAANTITDRIATLRSAVIDDNGSQACDTTTVRG
eukprot:14314030-Alexandrium_andersonii.AAC.1